MAYPPRAVERAMKVQEVIVRASQGSSPQPELQRCWTTRDRAANVQLFRLASEVLRAIEAGVFPPVVGWQCKECPFRSKCWALG